MKRREFVAGLAAAALPFPGHAQPANIPVIGFMSTRAAKDSGRIVEAFEKGLAEEGFSAGRNVTIDYRFADGVLDRLPGLAAELVSKPVTVLAAVGGANSALVARKATSTIPIVFVLGADPVALGLASSLANPGGNATGMTIFSATLGPKRLGLLREMVPSATRFAAINNVETPEGKAQAADMEQAAQSLGIKLRMIEAGNEAELVAAFATLTAEKTEALLVGSNPIYDVYRDRIVALAATAAIPAIYQFRDFTAAGGLMSYDPDLVDAHRQIGLYAGQILKGAKPATLPIQQPTKFNFLINLKTAKALGIEVPANLLARADEVIE